jgi:hypothetical protein
MLTETLPPGRIPIRELQAALESVLAGTGSGGRVEWVRRRRSAYSSSHEIDNVDVRLSCGTELRLVVKNLSPASRLPAARKVRPDFLYHAGREIGTYTRVLHARSLGTARCYGSLVSTEPERRWLFLERVEGIPLWQA